MTAVSWADDAAPNPWEAPLPTAPVKLAEAPAAEPERAHPFPGNVLMHIAGMGRDSENMVDADQETRTVVESPDHAVVVTSLWHGDRRSPFDAITMHRPVIDIDWPVTVRPSRTEGHSHLFIDRPITWEQYLGILDAFAAAGIVEPGYVKAARTRGHSAVRVPWVKGDHPAVALPKAEADARNRGVDYHARKLIRAIRSGDIATGTAAADALAATLGGVGEAGR